MGLERGERGDLGLEIGQLSFLVLRSSALMLRSSALRLLVAMRTSTPLTTRAEPSMVTFLSAHNVREPGSVVAHDLDVYADTATAFEAFDEIQRCLCRSRCSWSPQRSYRRQHQHRVLALGIPGRRCSALCAPRGAWPVAYARRRARLEQLRHIPIARALCTAGVRGDSARAAAFLRSTGARSSAKERRWLPEVAACSRQPSAAAPA
jgi:hypothetical protein